MKFYAMILARRPIGRLIPGICRVLSQCEALVPVELSLGPHRFSEANDEFQKLAEALVNEKCEIKLRNGQFDVHWNHAPDARTQEMTLLAEISPTEVPSLPARLTELCTLVGATYALFDQVECIDSDKWPMGMHPITPNAVYSLYWFNWFGREYKGELPIGDEVSKSVWKLERQSDGATLILLSEQPEPQHQTQVLKTISKAWPFFLSLQKNAHFIAPIDVDLSEIRSCQPPPGQYFLEGGARISTAARFRWLNENGFWHWSRGNHEPFHIIRPDFCRLAEIAPDDMLVLYINSILADRYDQQVRNAYEARPDQEPLRERIWLAHQKGLRSSISDQVMDLVKQKFFADLPPGDPR